MAGSSRQHRGEKRRKELARKERQEVKRQRKAERKAAGAAGGPPIDWEAGTLGPSSQGESDSEPTPETHPERQAS
jgi:hypothetical protein